MQERKLRESLQADPMKQLKVMNTATNQSALFTADMRLVERPMAIGAKRSQVIGIWIPRIAVDVVAFNRRPFAVTARLFVTL